MNVAVPLSYASGPLLPEPTQKQMAMPPEQQTWHMLAVFILSDVADYWLSRKVGDRELCTMLACVNTRLRTLIASSGARLDGWTVHIWKPEDIWVNKNVTFIAVDPDGMGHSIEALALGNTTA